MPYLYSRRVIETLLVFDLEDAYARELAGQGHPRPAEPLEFWLVGQVSPQGVLLPYQPVPRMEILRNESGYHLFFGREALKIRGQARLVLRRLDLPPAVYRVRVTSPLYQPAEKDVTLPMRAPNQPGGLDEYTIHLWPGAAYPFPGVYPVRLAPGASCVQGIPTGRGPTLLRGSLHAFDGTPRVGARVRVAGRAAPTFTTGPSGDWVLWFPETQPTGRVTIQVELPGLPAVDLSGVCVVKGREASLHETALRGWVRRGRAGFQGASVSIPGAPGPLVTGPGGAWSYYFPLDVPGGNVTVTAALPDGQSLSQNVQAVQRATVVVPAFDF